MKNLKEVYGYERMDLQVAHKEYDKASRWVDVLVIAGGILLGYLATFVL